MRVVTAERTTEQNIQYWGEQQDALGFETVWSIWECFDVDQKLLKDTSHRVYYRFLAADATVDQIMNGTAEEIEVRAVAMGGSVRDLWAAAESCFQQAKKLGDWHKFIENFEATDEGFEMVMGS